MTFSLRAALCGLLMLAAPAAAEQANNTLFDFSANFPCQSQTMPQTVNTPLGTIQVNLFICELDNHAFGVSVADYPAGTVTDDNIDSLLAGAAAGSAANVQGTVRDIQPFTLGRYVGREAIIDSNAMGMTIRTRIFLVGDRLYQVMAVMPSNQENAPAAIGFLNSFRIRR